MTSGGSSSSAAARVDPLTLLRRAISARSDIHLLSESNSKVFSLALAKNLSLPAPPSGRTTIPKTLTTRYRRPGAPREVSPVTHPDQFYDCQSILCCYLNRDKGFAAYIQEANQQSCSFISATERKAVTDFLEGKSGSVEPSSVVSLESCLGSYSEYLLEQTGSSGLTSGGQDPSNLAVSGAGQEATSMVESSGTRTSLNESTETRTKRERYVIDKVDQELVKRIMQLHEPKQLSDRRTVLRGAKPVNFDSARLLVIDRIKARREEMKNRTSGTSGIGPTMVRPVTPSGTTPGGGKRRPMNPIIIISPSSSALITMHNVKRFLEDAVFEPPNLARGTGSQLTTSEDVIVVNHKRGYSTSQYSTNPSQNPSSSSTSSSTDRSSRYFIVDGVEALSKFGEDAWDRVVCVLTTGQEWQFRPYKWSDPKELFHHVKGFFVQWTHDPPNPKVRAWNVTELRIDESKRHIDKSAAADFWRSLEAWIALHKPFVAY